MEYHEAVNWLFDLRRFSPRTGVEHTRRLLGHLDDPHESYRCVQVAGSNGKGSTARMAERALREAGYDVGLYTSPHLDDIRERVRIDGRKVTKSAVRDYVETVEGYVTARAAENESPTFFETVTGLALWAFDRADVDVAVLEVGIGGKHDATSAVDPVASAVTNVTLEHADVLGDTVPEIARDIAHVAPAGAPLVTAAEGEALTAVREVANDVVTVGSDAVEQNSTSPPSQAREDADERSSSSPPSHAQEDADVSVAYRGRDGLEGVVRVDGPDLGFEAHLPLLGPHQAQNAGVAAALCRQVGDVSTADLRRGFRNAHWPGRFEVMERDPLVVLDGAHNPGGCASLAEALREFDYADLHLVFGSMADKDHAGMAAALPRADVAYACRPDIDRAETAPALAASLDGHVGAVREAGDVPGALAAAIEAAGPDDCVLVTGSLFTVAEARRRWSRVDIPKRVPDLETAEAVLADADVPEAGDWRARASGVHRVLKTRVSPRRARDLQAAMLSVGGDCALSGLEEQDRDLVDVVLTGTLAECERLVEELADRPDGTAALGEQLGDALDLAPGRASHGYPWEDRTAVMGVLNVTPDSFHDGGEYDALEDAVARAEAMIDAGADVVDVGGESTRPGADVVPVEEEKARVLPVVEQLADADVLVSVDTRKAEVARAALEAGADVLNDVSGLEDPEMRLVAAEHDVPVVVMHSIEAPVDPDTEIEYDDVVEDTIEALIERVLLAERAGLDRSQVIIDPGLGFGKTRRENFELLGRVGEFRALGCPVLVGHSHKSMFDLVGLELDERLPATVAATSLLADRGADIVRVHDVEENVAAVRTVEAAEDPDVV